MSIADLRRILREVAGAPEVEVADDDFVGVDLDSLGYDSLALMAAAARIKEDYGAVIPDDLLADLRTPREILGFVNDAVPEAR